MGKPLPFLLKIDLPIPKGRREEERVTKEIYVTHISSETELGPLSNGEEGEREEGRQC